MKRYSSRNSVSRQSEKKLDEVRLRVQEACQKCYLKARLDLFEEVQEALKEYTECLNQLQICHKDYINTLHYIRSQEFYLEDIEKDLDDIRYELGRNLTQQKQKEAELLAVQEQLKLTDYEKIKEQAGLLHGTFKRDSAGKRSFRKKKR